MGRRRWRPNCFGCSSLQHKAACCRPRPCASALSPAKRNFSGPLCRSRHKQSKDGGAETPRLRRILHRQRISDSGARRKMSGRANHRRMLR